MSKFADLLNQPLPSAAGSVTESCATECGDGLDGVVTPAVEPVAPIAEPAPAEAPVADPVDAAIATDDGEAEELTPEESQRVDDVMNTVATPMLLAEELDEEEIKEFVESVESDVCVGEGFLTERTIVRFDKYARKAQLYEVAVAAVAREKKDPLYKKLNIVYKMERILKAKLRKKYNAQATAKVKEYLKRAKKSKSGVLARIANKIAGK